MRDSRKKEENWAIEKLNEEIKDEKWTEDESITDRPDLVLENENGKRIGCEITQIGIQELMQWKNDPKYQLDVNELDVFTFAREANVWLEKVLDKKNPKVSEYLQENSLKEMWLLIHSSMDKSHDVLVFNKDEEYDIPLLNLTINNYKHKFDRIYVLSSNHGIYQAFPNDSSKDKLPKLLKQMSIKSLAMNTTCGGVTRFNMEKKPERHVILPPIGNYSIIDKKYHFKYN